MQSSYMKSKMKSYMLESLVEQLLQAMLEDESYRTLPGYSIDTETYPDHNVPFVAAHMHYLKKHPQVDPEHYLSNLRLMLKIR
jgi:maltodextrin utilization protein YvdJ